MEVDAWAAGTAGGGRDGDVDGAVDRAQELPKDRGGGVADDCAVATGEHRRHEAAMEAQAAVADCVDAAMDAVKLASLYSSRDAVLAHPELLKLRDVDHAVPSSCNSRHRRIECVDFLPHVKE